MLRAKVGDCAYLFDGTGAGCVWEILEIDKKTARGKAHAYKMQRKSLDFDVHIALCISRGERMDWAIQKACELGANCITPLWSERTEVKLKDDKLKKRLTHWQEVALNAAEQAHAPYPTLIGAPQALFDFVRTPHLIRPDGCPLPQLPHYEVAPKTRLVLAPQDSPYLPSNVAGNAYVLLIGAEGGLSPKELETTTQAGFATWQLGRQILRTETAPAVALSALLTLSIASL